MPFFCGSIHRRNLRDWTRKEVGEVFYGKIAVAYMGQIDLNC